MTPPEKTAVCVIGLVWLVSTAIWLTPGITIPDGAGYFAYLPSTWLDRDLLFFNEWQRFGLIDQGRILFKEITPTNHLGNHWTVGGALFWYPSYVAGDIARIAFPSLQRFSRNGVSLPYNVAVVIASAVAGLLTLLIGWQVSRRVAGSGIAALACVATWFGTPLMWYAIKNSLVAHAVSAMACALVVLLSLRLRDCARERGSPDRRLLFAAGLAAGYAFIVRPQNAPFALVPLILVELRFWRVSLLRAGLYPLGMLVGALPQLVVSSVIYGSPLGFLAGEPRSGWIFFERIWTWEPLFSWFHGLLSWSPLVALSIVGWLLLFRSERRLAMAAIFCFLSQWLINATLDRSFWGGFAFGQRRFDNCAVFFILGAAALFARLPRLVAVVLAAVTSAWTLSLFLAAGSVLDLNLYYTPSELLGAQASAVAKARIELLAAVPPGLKPEVLRIAMVTLAVLFAVGGAIFLARRKAPGSLPAAAAIYFLMMGGFLLFCGMNGSARLGQHAQLIAYNRTPAVLARLPGWRVELLRQELRYLEKSGRSEAAERTRRDLEATLRRVGSGQE